MSHEAQRLAAYAGTDNLEVLLDAVNYNQHIVNLLKQYISPNHNVMDAGAGIGTFAEMMIHIAPKLICFEPDHKQSNVIRAKGLNVVERIDSEGFNESQHVIYSLNVLEHIQDDVEALRQWHQSLAPMGSILLYVPAMPCLFSAMDVKVGHYRRYTRKELMSKVNAAGYNVERCEYVDSLGVLATLIYKWIGNKNGDINPKTIIFYDRVAFPISKLLDKLFRYFFGKNLFLVAHKRSGTADALCNADSGKSMKKFNDNIKFYGTLFLIVGFVTLVTCIIFNLISPIQIFLFCIVFLFIGMGILFTQISIT